MKANPKKNTLFLFLMVCIFSLYSCDILRFNFETFSIDYFEVSSWSPGDGYHSDPENITVFLNFTLDPDRASVERNFSLTADGSRVRGTFFWNDKRMTFIPLAPLEFNTDYAINLTADAHNTKGLSMDEDFNGEFTTRPNNERPVLLSCYPQMYEEINDPRTEIRLVFSVPVPLSSIYSNVSFSPSMNGSWRLEDEDTTAIFTPVEQWTHRTRYEIRFSTSLTDNNGMNIGNDFLNVFTVGVDNESPYLLFAQRITKDGEAIDLDRCLGNENIENEGWEKEDKLALTFSKPVDWITVKNYLSAVAEAAHDAPSLVMETTPLGFENSYNAEFVFKFESIPAFESRFTIQLKKGVKDAAGNESIDEYVYRIFANGQYSKPPKFAGFRMPMAPQNFTDLKLFSVDIESIFRIIPISEDYYPSGKNISTWIELYFDAAADIDPFSVMDFFSVETSNSVINFSPRQVKTTNFSVPEPHTGWEKYQRIEIAGILTNSTNYGVIYVRIGAGLSDSLGNKNEKLQRISVIK